MPTFEADDWAPSEAAPSEEEIRRVRRLISRVEVDLEDLTEQDRAQIEEAVSVVRCGRTVMLGMPPHPPAQDGSPVSPASLQAHLARAQDHNSPGAGTEVKLRTRGCCRSQ
ncbi:hypothetical protein [Streptomyces melanogenes]|uniref:hypothetical protein n=1 Tax=Streptomyces melanogenes TaxID=67326 RepID=UPI00167D13F8|nr:hypothetical protein [Streptomyces melanogenes]GGP56533.1 hypothetical protein GCM10010278_37000 [Streptomyces melanogenes]